MNSDSPTKPNADSSSEPAESRGTASNGDSVADRQADSTSQPLPEQFGRYRIVRLLGEGAMGKVYLAHDDQLDREIALKVPRFSAKGDDQRIERFYREARAAATIRHPNLCPIYDVGDIDGQPYLTMAYIEGRPLSDCVRQGKPLPQRQAAIVICKLARGLAAAHRRNVTHRDLKPANIMIDERNEPIVMDFGLAQRERDNEPQLTEDGTLLGTPAYMPPEQVLGDPELIGPPADIYSLGVVFYESLTGELPFQGPVTAVLAQVLNAEPPSPSEFRKDIDPELESICQKAMEKSLDDRYKSMDELEKALTAYLRSGAGKTGAHPAIAGLGDTERNQANPHAPATKHPNAERTAITDAQTQPARSCVQTDLPKRPWRMAAVVLAVFVSAGVVIHFTTRNGEDARLPKLIRPNGGSRNSIKQPLAVDELMQFAGHVNPVVQITFSPDGRWMLTGTSVGNIRLWDVKSGKELRQFDGHTGRIQSLAFSDTATQFISTAIDGVRLWNIVGNAPPRHFETLGFEGMRRGGLRATFTSDGMRAVRCGDGKFEIWSLEDDVPTLETTRLLKHVNFMPLWTYIRPTDQVLLFRFKGDLHLVDLRRQEARILIGAKVAGPWCSLAASSDGSVGLSSNVVSGVILWDLSTKKELRRLKGHKSMVTSAVFSHDGRFVLTGGGVTKASIKRSGETDYSIRLWEVKTGQEIHRFSGHTLNVLTLALSPDGHLAASSSSDHTIRLWRLPETLQ